VVATPKSCVFFYFISFLLGAAGTSKLEKRSIVTELVHTSYRQSSPPKVRGAGSDFRSHIISKHVKASQVPQVLRKSELLMW